MLIVLNDCDISRILLNPSIKEWFRDNWSIQEKDKLGYMACLMFPKEPEEQTMVQAFTNDNYKSLKIRRRLLSLELINYADTKDLCIILGAGRLRIHSRVTSETLEQLPTNYMSFVLEELLHGIRNIMAPRDNSKFLTILEHRGVEYPLPERPT